MDQIRSSNLRLKSRSFIINNASRKFEPSRETFVFFEDDVTCASEEKIPDYQLAEMQRRKKHFDEFKKLYNNKLEEKEARKKEEEEEQKDAFLQHPITKLLSKYGFKVPGKMSANSLRSHRVSEFKRSRYRSVRSRSRSGSASSGRSSIMRERERLLEPTVSFSDMEIVDIYQRHANRQMQHAKDKHVKISSVNPPPTAAERREDQTSNKLREEIAELEDRFNCILKSFQKTFPHPTTTEFTAENNDDESQG